MIVLFISVVVRCRAEVDFKSVTGEGDCIMTTNINNVMPADVPMWTEAESNTLNQCGTYAIALQRLVRELEEQGTTDVELPQYPKAELQQILNGDAAPKKNNHCAEQNWTIICEIIWLMYSLLISLKIYMSLII